MTEGQISFQLLGSPFIEWNGDALKIETRKASALLFYLAVTGETHTRETLSTMLWPESDQSRARGALRRNLAALRKTPLKEWLEVDRETLGLRRDEGLTLDVAEFENRLGSCTTHGHAETEVCSACLTPLIEAVNLYRGDFLTGFSLGNCPIFDDWQFFLAEDLRRDMTGALEKLVHYLSAQKQFETAVAYARQWLSFDPLHEPAHRQLMQLYAGTGQRNAALRQYQECVRVLEQELGVPPLEETTQLFQYIQDYPEAPLEVRPQHVIGESVFANIQAAPAIAEPILEPTISPPGVGLQNFPLPSTPFVGREEELASVLERLQDPACRLLTLLGPGGMGKTRLSIQAAHQANGAYPDGIYFIPLSPLSSPTSLLNSVADILQFSFYPNRDPQEQLLDFLREKKMLLLMDNFEHLVEAADFLQKVLETAPGLKFLITSRVRINLQGEWVIELQGLKFPEVDRVKEIEDYSAVQLFMQSAKRIGGDEILSEKDQPAVIRICKLIGGIPLGIELAATWVRILSCEEIAQEIEHNLDFLVASSRDIPERHQSLRAVFEHSWNLLPLEEQRIFRRMSVFHGGFQKEASQRVAGASLAVLSSLADKSLLLPTHGGRYDMHAVLRQYAEEKLEEIPEEKTQTRDRHSQYYAEFLNQRADHLRRSRQEEAARVIGEEIENLRYAWQWAVERRSAAEIDIYASCLFLFYEMRGWFMEGEEIFDLAAEKLQSSLDTTDKISTLEEQTLARVLARQGGFAYAQGDYGKSQTLLERSLNIARKHHDEAEIAFSLNYLGALLRLLGEYDKAREQLEESIAISRKTGDLRKLGRACNILAVVAASIGDYDQAEALFQESLDTFKKIGDLWGISKARENLGNVANLLGNYEKASTLYQESLVTFRRINDQHGVASCLINTGTMAYAMEEYQHAVDLYMESLEIFREIGVLWSIGLCQIYLGKAHLALGDHPKADEYFHAAFKTSVDSGAIPISLSVLVGMASLYMAEGNPQQALEYLTLAVSHPSCDQDTRDQAEELLVELEKQIPKTVITRARESMKDNHLKKLILVAEEILKREDTPTTSSHLT